MNGLKLNLHTKMKESVKKGIEMMNTEVEKDIDMTIMRIGKKGTEMINIIMKIGKKGTEMINIMEEENIEQLVNNILLFLKNKLLVVKQILQKLNLNNNSCIFKFIITRGYL